MTGRRGRPPQAHPREIPVAFRLTVAEYRYLQRLSLREGKSIVDVIRARALADMPPESPPGRERQAESGGLS